MTEQAFSLVAGFIKDRRPASPAAAGGSHEADSHPDVVEQFTKLAALRGQDILTDDEFAAKKAELLARL
jgi:hypothetical protein